MYLVGVAAVLFIVYMLILALYHATPRKRVILQKSSGMTARLSWPGPESVIRLMRGSAGVIAIDALTMRLTRLR